MKLRANKNNTLIIGVAVILCLVTLPISLAAGPTFIQQKQDSQGAKSANHQQSVAAFEQRVKDYVKLREQLEEKMPDLSKEAKPEEIQAHKATFQERVRAARAGAKPGDIFTPDIVNHIRTTIKKEFKGRRLQELRETILEAETQGVPIRINYPYPSAKELSQVPPTLLLILPQLPKQMRYRFVSRHMLLVDRENHLIVDYMLDALP